MPELSIRLNAPQSKALRHLNPGMTVVTPWGRGVGKALDCATPIPTPSGWTTMGELSPGDVVFDEAGNPCRVVRTTDVMHGRQCFEVLFDDGARIVADAEHQWFTWDKRARKSHGRSDGRTLVDPGVRTTLEIKETLRVSHGREVNHSVAMCKPLQLDDADLPLDPYVLGYWLGNGSTSSNALTIGAHDFEAISDEMASRGIQFGKPYAHNGAFGVTMLGLTATMRDMGLLGRKFVPDLYMRASERQRRDVLAGLLDSDGYCAEGGKVEFTSTLRSLAEGFLELAHSLGIKASLAEGVATLNGKDCGPKYRVTFYTREKLFRLPRKNAMVSEGRAQATRTSHRYIVAVNPVPSVPVRCIEVNSPSHLFLAGPSMVPTHNSKFQRDSWFLRVAELDGRPNPKNPNVRGVRIILLAPTFKQAVDVHGKALQNDLNGTWKCLGGVLNKTTYRVDFPGGSWIQFFGAENADAVRGMRCDIITVDECDDVDPAVYDAICQPWLSEPWSLKIRLVGGTPRRGRYGLLWKLWSLGKANEPGFYAIHATYRDAPGQVSQEFVEEVRRTTPPAIFAREWECDPDSAEGLVFPMFSESSHVRKVDPDRYATEFLIGGDFGWEDPGVLLVAAVYGSGKDAVVHVIDEIYQPHKESTWWQERAAELVKAYPGARWYLDPSRPDMANMYRARGARIQQTDNSIEEGVACVADMLCLRAGPDGIERPRLLVDPRCKNLIREFGVYRRKRDPRNKDRILDDIQGGEDHALDSLRYALRGRFGGPNGRRTDYGAGDYDRR